MKQVLLFVSFVCLSTVLHAQVDRAKVVGGYVYNFAKLSSSEKQKELSTYNITVVTDQMDLRKEFKKIESNKKVNGKSVKLTFSSNSKFSLENCCLIFIGFDKLNLYDKIFKATSKFEILLVSENYKNKRQIMLNLYESKNKKMLFEMNKGNIYGRRIKIDDEVLLMGGTEIDLAKLYISSQKQLQHAEKNYKAFQDSITYILNQLDDKRKEVNNLTLETKTQNDIIRLQKMESDTLQNDIDNYQQLLRLEQEAYSISQKKLDEFNESLKLTKRDLLHSKEEIDNNKKYLQMQKSQIEKNKATLSQKNQIIKNQRIVVIFFIIGGIITLILFVLLLRSFWEKKRKNKLLEKQKKEIAEQNKLMKKNQNLIESMMEELSESNEELTASLEENKRIQNKLIQSEKMASLGVLSAGIAHEINNPINFVYAGINSLLRDFEDIEPVINEVSNLDIDNDNLKEKTERIKKLKEENYFDDAMEAIPHIINDIKLGADRTAEIVKGLRNFSRMDSDVFEPLQINEGLDTSLLLLKNKYKNRIEIIKNYEKNLPVLVCYPGKINQAFLNVLSNAVDSIQEKGKIWITTSHNNGSIKISIKDSGTGIPEDVQKKIFDPFFTTKPVGDGTGLGLSITFGIINEHHGTIDVISENNKGSEFIISLPLK